MVREVARPERFELPTPKFVAWCSIQLSYGRVLGRPLAGRRPENVAEREGFEPSKGDLVTLTPLAGERFRPLSHLSAAARNGADRPGLLGGAK